VIAQAAAQILRKCAFCGWGGPDVEDKSYWFPITGQHASGQIFFPDNWNVIIRHDDNNC
jgi:hypothetical protein